MLFNSHVFIFVFLPLTLLGFFGLGRLVGRRAALVWLVMASLFYYGWWNPRYLTLLLASMGFNYALGRALPRHNSRLLISLGVGVNLAGLAWFKYAGFLVASIDDITSTSYHLHAIILPLAISFFTFQQISYLVDVHRGGAPERDLLHYALFVSFFPQLIAGPIVQQREMVPQFLRDGVGRLNREHFAVGITLFFMGLFKKVVLADGVAIYASPVFEAAHQGAHITFFEGWGAALAYTYQIYFDFSGYSDMALGLARMFGFKLPVNFDSPYQANSIIDFWRRWHMTLSRFLKQYLYIPLGGNRRGRTRLYVNLMITMVLGGLWHGAGWTFVVWGTLHGVFLVTNVIWRRWRQARSEQWAIGRNEILAGRLLTFALVVVARVFFRSPDFSSAIAILRGIFGLEGAVLDARLVGILGWLQPVVRFEGTHAGYFNLYGVPWLIALGLICWFAPNPVKIMGRYRPALDMGSDFFTNLPRRFPLWGPDRRWALVMVVVAVLAIVHLTRVSEFIYYQF